MNPTRIWTFGAVAAVLAIFGGAVGLGVQPQLAAASAADASTTQVQQAIDLSQSELTRLSKVAAQQADLVKEEERLGSAVTGSLRLNTFSRQLRSVAATNGVQIVALNPSAAVVYAPLVSAAAAAAPADAAASGSTPTPTPTPAATPAVEPGQFGATDALVTPTNFSVIPVTVTVTGSRDAGVAFAQDVQQMNRLFAVDTVTFAAGTGVDAVPTTTISGNIYSLTP